MGKNKCDNCQKQFSCTQEREQCEGFVEDDVELDFVLSFTPRDRDEREALCF